MNTICGSSNGERKLRRILIISEMYIVVFYRQSEDVTLWQE